MIEKLDRYALMLLTDVCDHILARMTSEEQSEWEGTPFGIQMMHARVRMLGLPYVADNAPSNWAWQLIGELGCGYTGNYTVGTVRRLLSKKGWHHVG